MSNLTYRHIETSLGCARTSVRESPSAYNVTGGLVRAIWLPATLLAGSHGGGEFIVVTFGVTGRQPYAWAWWGAGLPQKSSRVAHATPERAWTGEPEDPISPTGRIAGAQTWLGLNAKQVADVLKVHRTTLYDWYHGATPQDRYKSRIKALFELARYWHTLSDEPLGPLLKTPLAKGGTMLSLLQTAELSVDDLGSTLRDLAKRLGEAGGAVEVERPQRVRRRTAMTRSELRAAYEQAANDAAYLEDQAQVTKAFDATAGDGLQVEDRG